MEDPVLHAGLVDDVAYMAVLPLLQPLTGVAAHRGMEFNTTVDVSSHTRMTWTDCIARPNAPQTISTTREALTKEAPFSLATAESRGAAPSKCIHSLAIKACIEDIALRVHTPIEVRRIGTFGRNRSRLIHSASETSVG